MRALTYIVLFLVAFSARIEPQEIPLLYPIDEFPVSGWEGGSVHSWCEPGGEIYLQGLGSAMPIAKLSAEGRVLERFGLDSVPNPEVKRGFLQSFAVGPGDNVFLLVRGKSDQVFIVEFNEEGVYQQTVEAHEKDFLPYHIAVFPTHDFLLTGVKLGPQTLSKAGGESSLFSGPLTAAFDPRGQLLKEVSLPEDITRKAAAKEFSVSLSGPTREDNALAMSVGEGGAVPGADGNVYLLRASDPPIVYVVSSAGEVIRRMVLDPPAKKLNARFGGMAAGRLVVLFDSRPRGLASRIATPYTTSWYSLYDAQTGDRLIDYKPSPELKGAFVCSAGNDFVFLGMRDRRLVLIDAKPR